MEFEWDAKKEADNLRTHRVSFAEAVESFSIPRGYCSSTRNTRGGGPILLVGKSASGGSDDALHPRGTKLRIIGWRNGENSGGCTVRNPASVT